MFGAKHRCEAILEALASSRVIAITKDTIPQLDHSIYTIAQLAKARLGVPSMVNISL